MKNFILIMIPALIFLSACRPADENSDREGLDSVMVVDLNRPHYKLTLEHDFTISQMDFPQIQSVLGVLTEEDGSFFIRDTRSSQFHEFDDSANFVRTYGRNGQGPGEFIHIASAALLNGYLFGLDTIQLVVHQYSTSTGELTATLNVSQAVGGEQRNSLHTGLSKIIPASDTSFYLSSQPRFTGQRADTVSWHRFSFNGGESGEEFLRYPTSDYMYSETGVSSNTLTSKSKMERMPDGGFVYSHGGQGQFSFYSSENELLRSIELDIPRRPIADEDFAVNSSGMMAGITGATEEKKREDYIWAPDEWPAWDNFVVASDGNIWIRVNSNPPDEREWWVVSPEGEFLACHAEDNITAVPVITDKHIYYSQYNEAQGASELHRYSYSLD